MAIIELLWETERLTARQIREQLYGDSEKAQHGTVQRLLQSLEESSKEENISPVVVGKSREDLATPSASTINFEILDATNSNPRMLN